MSDLDKILQYLAAHKSRLFNEYHLTKIGVFGSFAHNEQDGQSDIDLIVEFENNTQDLYSIKQAMKEEIEKRFGRSVEICREKYIKPHFKEKIRSEARYVWCIPKGCELSVEHCGSDRQDQQLHARFSRC